MTRRKQARKPTPNRNPRERSRRDTAHHRKPRSLGGGNESENISFVPGNKHEAFHLLFANKTPYEIADILNAVWLDPAYELVCFPKRFKTGGSK